VNTFNTDGRTPYLNALRQAVGEGPAIAITSVTAGSINVGSSVTFYGDTAASSATNYVKVLSDNVTSIFPSSTFGPVQVQASSIKTQSYSSGAAAIVAGVCSLLVALAAVVLTV
jgi:hypothetical protein